MASQVGSTTLENKNKKAADLYQEGQGVAQHAARNAAGEAAKSSRAAMMEAGQNRVSQALASAQARSDASTEAYGSALTNAAQMAQEQNAKEQELANLQAQMEQERKTKNAELEQQKKMQDDQIWSNAYINQYNVNAQKDMAADSWKRDLVTKAGGAAVGSLLSGLGSIFSDERCKKFASRGVFR